MEGGKSDIGVAAIDAGGGPCGSRPTGKRLDATPHWYRTLVELSPDLIAVHQDGRVVFFNDPGAKMLGATSADELIGRPLSDFLSPGRLQQVRARIQTTLREGDRSPVYEQLIRRLDGTDLPVEVSGMPFEFQGRPAVLVVARDIRERKRAESEKAELLEQLHHAQKMQAIGTLAGGIAHDFNNILGALLAGLSVLSLKTGDRYQADLEEMEATVRRGADLTKQLLGMSRRGKFEARPVDVSKAAAKTAAMFGRTRPDLELDLAFAPDLDHVLMDPAQFEQTLLNLLVNAGHALPGPGRIRIRGKNARLDQPTAERRRVQAGNYVELEVTDNGCGMDSETLSRAFEPFYTTRTPGAGSGLGLASVYGIVTNHGGSVTASSRPGHGSEFTLLLPATDTAAPPDPHPGVEPPRGAGTILVVDDELYLLGAVARGLRELGYEVLTAATGATAIEHVRRHGARISLVILDMTMPGMSDVAIFTEIRAVVPDLRVLLSSGYSVDGRAQALLDRGCDGFIQKPYNVAQLSRTILDLLR